MGYFWFDIRQVVTPRSNCPKVVRYRAMRPDGCAQSRAVERRPRRSQRPQQSSITSVRRATSPSVITSRAMDLTIMAATGSAVLVDAGRKGLEEASLPGGSGVLHTRMEPVMMTGTNGENAAPDGDVRWLSYDELAAALGIKRASAVARVGQRYHMTATSELRARMRLFLAAVSSMMHSSSVLDASCAAARVSESSGIASAFRCSAATIGSIRPIACSIRVWARISATRSRFVINVPVSICQ